MSSASQNNLGRKPLVIGVGHRDRGDDAVGPTVADCVRLILGFLVETTVIEGDLSDLALCWDAGQDVTLVDAMSSGRQPGTVSVLDGLTAELGQQAGMVSSHGIGVGDAVELARVLGRLPRTLTVYGIEAASFEHFTRIDERVSRAAADVLESICASIRDQAGDEHSHADF